MMGEADLELAKSRLRRNLVVSGVRRWKCARHGVQADARVLAGNAFCPTRGCPERVVLESVETLEQADAADAAGRTGP